MEFSKRNMWKVEIVLWYNKVEKIKVVLKGGKNTQTGGELGFSKTFQHKKFKHNISKKNKEIELENSNLDFYNGSTLSCLRPLSSIS